MTVELSRATVLPGKSAEADRWMAMLQERHAECVATLDRERMAVEVVFRSREQDGAEYLWWFSLRGSDDATLEGSPFAIDADHEVQARRTRIPGWLEAEPQVVFLPAPVRAAIENRAVRHNPGRWRGSPENTAVPPARREFASAEKYPVDGNGDSRDRGDTDADHSTTGWAARMVRAASMPSRPSPQTPVSRDWLEPTFDEGDSGAATADSVAAAVAATAIAEAELATQAALTTQAAVLAAARTVAEAAAATARGVAAAVAAKAAVVAAAAAASAEARRIEIRLTHEVLHDGLTGLADKRLLVDRLTQALARAHRAGTFVAVLFIDIDNFKAVNDTFGHAAGDRVLIGVARRLEACLRDTDTCARVGGDEFVVVCEDFADPSDVPRAATVLETALAARVAVGDQNLPVHVSVGIAISSAGSMPLDLLNAADLAMYQAKERRDVHEGLESVS